MKDTKTGYSTYDGYFDELKARIMTAVENGQAVEDTQPALVVTWRLAFKRMVGFAAGFILLVAITSTVYYFAAGKTQQNETELATQDIFLLYGIDEDDILDKIGRAHV